MIMMFRRCTAPRCTEVRRWLPLSAALLVLAGCGGFGEAMTAHTDVVARAAGKELRVTEASELLASNPQIPADPQVARALADVWVDYMLLAHAVAEDPSLSMLDMEAFVRPMREQMLMGRLRDRVIQVDTVFTDEQLQARWRTDGPGAEISARHILLRVPAEATPAQRDSVQQLAASLRQRAVAGEDFAALAQQFSQDPGSAARGGDLGFFGRGRMVAPFDEAAFALQPGEISNVVESPFGYHVIRVDDRRQPQLTEEREEFRQFLVQNAQQEAETAYLDSLTAAANVQIRPGGLAVVREIASRPDVTLRGRSAEREIATYDRGAYTTGEFAEFIRSQPPQTQSAFATANDEQLESAVQQLTRSELLMQQARSQNITITPQEEEELRAEMRGQIQQLLQATGLAQFSGQSGNTAAIDAHVRTLIADGVAGRSQLVPLGPLGFALRDRYPSEINEGAFSQVIAQLEQVRARQPAPDMGGSPQGQPQPQQQPQPDTQPQPQQPGQ
jgi:peptidyl-prolyl cis-trans isomerase C